MNVAFDKRVGDLYEKLYTTVRTCIPESTDESVNVALSAINGLAVVLAVHNGVSREDFNNAVMYTFDQYIAHTTRAVDQGVH
jgi:hypothetical protein